jgi:DNA-directed RNA polymerase specialized sigma24 family protein
MQAPGTTSEWSVTQWIAQIKQGDGQAANRLWERYFASVQALARGMLHGAPRRAADEEDVAASVFESFFAGAAEQRFNELTDRDDLWCLLIAITKKKSVDHRRVFGALKRGGNHVWAASELDNSGGRRLFDELLGTSPSPAEVAQLDEDYHRLMACLRDDSLREVARWRMARYSIKEIAAELGITMRAVERKLHLIRECWTRELDKGAGA